MGFKVNLNMAQLTQSQVNCLGIGTGEKKKMDRC